MMCCNSPKYMLRSYLYLVVHALPLKLANVLAIPGPIQFYLLRVIIAIVTASCESFFINAIARRFGSNTQRYSIIIHAITTGMFHSTVALLPQTFTMCFLLMTWASWMVRYSS
jgi:alpha-1,2-mannosyltransferase